MTIELDVQRASTTRPLPGDREFEQWVGAALRGRTPAVLTVRIVGHREMRLLNKRYRDKDAVTNVLSFAAEVPAAVGIPLLGDVVLCAPRVIEEAQVQGKAADAHWAHLTIHGVLHLLGYDHIEPADAAVMEALEVELLGELGVGNPYE